MISNLYVAGIFTMFQVVYWKLNNQCIKH